MNLKQIDKNLVNISQLISEAIFEIIASLSALLVVFFPIAAIIVFSAELVNKNWIDAFQFFFIGIVIFYLLRGFLEPLPAKSRKNQFIMNNAEIDRAFGYSET